MLLDVHTHTFGLKFKTESETCSHKQYSPFSALLVVDMLLLLIYVKNYCTSNHSTKIDSSSDVVCYYSFSLFGVFQFFLTQFKGSKGRER